jgi:hypothetical protein
MSSASSGSEHAGAGQPSRDNQPPPERPPLDPALLRQVIEQTLSAAEANAPIESIDLQRLKVVAHRRRGQPLTLEPVAVEMVRALLGPDFANLGRDPDAFLAMTSQIARSLVDDPASFARLAALWKRLTG